jgi:hypothetical protein
MYHLIDMFNRAIISSHRTMEAAQKAEAAHHRAVKRACGQSSYIPTQIIQGKKSEVMKIERLS